MWHIKNFRMQNYGFYARHFPPCVFNGVKKSDLLISGHGRKARTLAEKMQLQTQGVDNRVLSGDKIEIGRKLVVGR